MLLSDSSIVRSIKRGQIRLDPPFSLDQLRPAGIRIHLGSNVLVPKPDQVIDPSLPTKIEYDRHNLEDSYLLEPGSFALATTVERVRTGDNIICLLEGRSTIARLGLTIHNTASFLDGTQGTWNRPVLEIANHGPLRIELRAGLPIGMLCFIRLSSRASGQNVHDQYLGQDSVQPAALDNGAQLIDMLLQQGQLDLGTELMEDS